MEKARPPMQKLGTRILHDLVTAILCDSVPTRRSVEQSTSTAVLCSTSTDAVLCSISTAVAPPAQAQVSNDVAVHHY